MNEKGASWAYATPGFGAALHPAHLKLLRRMADTQDGIKATTEVRGVPISIQLILVKALRLMPLIVLSHNLVLDLSPHIEAVIY